MDHRWWTLSVVAVLSCKGGDPPAAGRPVESAAPAAPAPASDSLRRSGGACAADSDCARVDADCCGCTAGGQSASIRASEGDAYKAGLQRRCTEVMCMAAMSPHATCGEGARAVCRSGQCAMALADGGAIP